MPALVDSVLLVEVSDVVLVLATELETVDIDVYLDEIDVLEMETV